MIERALGEVNGFGSFQIRTILLLGLPALSMMSLWVMTVFWGQIPAHECVNGTAILVPCENNCHEIMNSTYTSDFDLMCDRAHLHPHLQSSLLAGSVLGEVTFGQLQDRIGRRTTILISIAMYTITLVCFVISAYAKNFPAFAASTFVVGLIAVPRALRLGSSSWSPLSL